jgi:hypothetical protein
MNHNLIFDSDAESFGCAGMVTLTKAGNQVHWPFQLKTLKKKKIVRKQKMNSQCTIRCLRTWMLLGQHNPISSGFTTFLENALTEVEEEPKPKMLFKSVLGNHVLCDTFIRTLDLAEDPAIQYLMLEIIICSLELCRSGSVAVFRVGARTLK